MTKSISEGPEIFQDILLSIYECTEIYKHIMNSYYRDPKHFAKILLSFLINRTVVTMMSLVKICLNQMMLHYNLCKYYKLIVMYWTAEYFCCFYLCDIKKDTTKALNQRKYVLTCSLITSVTTYFSDYLFVKFWNEWWTTASINYMVFFFYVTGKGTIWS